MLFVKFNIAYSSSINLSQFLKFILLSGGQLSPINIFLFAA